MIETYENTFGPTITHRGNERMKNPIPLAIELNRITDSRIRKVGHKRVDTKEYFVEYKTVVLEDGLKSQIYEELHRIAAVSSMNTKILQR